MSLFGSTKKSKTAATVSAASTAAAAAPPETPGTDQAAEDERAKAGLAAARKMSAGGFMSNIIAGPSINLMGSRKEAYTRLLGGGQ